MNKYLRVAKRGLFSTPIGGLIIRWGGVSHGSDLPAERESLSIISTLHKKPSSSYMKPSFLNEAQFDLSVIVPAYNAEKYISQCLRSVLEQSVDFSFEVIAVNDGSTDKTLNIIRDFDDSRIVILDQNNKGHSGSRNSAIDIARGRAIAFVDSDDMLATGSLQTLMNDFRFHDCDFVSGLHSKMSDDGHVIGIAEKKRTHGAPWARIYKREVWADIRFPEGYWFEDTVLSYCIAPRYKESFSSDAGYLRRDNPTSITKTASSSYKALDSYWIVEEMLDWCRRLEIPLGQQLYDQTLKQFGPLIYNRTVLLNEDERKALFVLCCALIQRTEEFAGLSTTLSGRWKVMEQALRSKNYGLWKTVCEWM